MLSSFRRGSGKTSSGDGPTTGTDTPKRSKALSIRALEPRFVFDGAAAQTAADASHAASDGAAAQKPADSAPKDAAAHGVEPASHEAPHASGEATAGRAETQPATAADGRPRVEIVVIDRNVPDIATLLKGVPDTAEVLLIDSQRDGFDQLAEALRGRADIDAIHILSHGTEGDLRLGTSELTSATIQGRYADDLATIGRALSANADLLIYGCDFAAGADGLEATRLLAKATGADVAASNDATGDAALGGDWDLEVHDGAIETHVAVDAAAQAAWHHVLAATADNQRGDLLAVSGRTIYSVNVATGKATALTTAPSSVGGITLGAALNSLAVDQANGLIYYVDNVGDATNKALFAYDFVNDQHILIDSDLTNNGVGKSIVTGSTGLGGAGAAFGGGKLYLAVENVSGSDDQIYALTFSASGRTVASASAFGSAITRSNDWGDLAVDTANNQLISITRASYTRLNLSDGSEASSQTGTRTDVQAGTDSGGYVYTLGANLQRIDGNTGAAVGSPLVITTDGSTSVGTVNDAASWSPPTSTISAKVFADANRDGASAGDSGIRNVTVQLIDDVNNNGVVDAGERVIATDTTAADGRYSFTGVLPGHYVVKVTDANGVLGPATETTTAATAAVVDAKVGAALAGKEFGYDLAPTVDLDADDSSGATGTGYRTTFTEKGAAVAIADADATVSRIASSVDKAMVVLTNAQTGDDLLSGTMPAGITATKDTSTPGRITITLTGAGTAADYGLALRAVSFTNGSAAPVTTDRAIDVTITSAGVDGPSARSAVAVSAVNDAPVNSVPAATQTVAEDTGLVFSTANGNAITVSDVDAGTSALTTTLSAAHGTVTLGSVAGVTVSGNGTAAVTVTGTAAQINTALNGTTYRGLTDYNGPDSLSVSTNDNGNTGSGGAQTRADAVAITVTPVNDAPVNSVPTATQTVAEDTALVFSTVNGNAITVADVDAGTSALTTTLSAAHGSVTLGSVAGVTVSGNGTASVTVTGTAAQINAALNGATYRGVTDYNGPDSLSVSTNDNGNTGSGGAQTRADAVAITVTPVDDAPVNATPGAQAFAEDRSLVFSTANGNAIAVSDPDGGAQTVRLTSTHGVLTLSRVTGLTFASGDGAADATMTFTGAIADVNAALEGLTFTPTADYNGSAQITVRTTDPATPASGFINGGFEQPDFTGAGFYIVDEGTVPGWRTEASDHKIEIWDSGHNGVPSQEGSQFAEINANSVGALYQVFQSKAGSALDVQFAHRGRLGVDTMKVIATDLGADGVLGTADDAVLLDENFSDGNAAWGAYSRSLTENASGNLVRFEFRSVAAAGGSQSVGNFVDGISIGQSLVAQSRIDLTITPVADAVNDAITTPEDTRASFNVLTGANGASADSFTNPDQAVTAVTQGAHGTVTFTPAGDVTYTPDRDFNGTDGFTYTVTSGGVTETATVTMTVTPVNDAPVAVADTITTREDTPVTFDPRLNDSDVDGDPLTVSQIDGRAIAAGQTVAVGNGSVALGLDGRLTFTPGQDHTGPASFTYAVRDPSGATATATVTVSGIDPVNDAPVNGLPTGQSVAEDGRLVFSAANGNAITVFDVDAGSGRLTTTIGLGHGTLTLGSTAGLTLSGDGTATVTLSGTVAQINAALDGAAYRPIRDYNGADSLVVTTTDNGNTGAGGPLADTDALAITVIPVNDAPVMAALPAQTGRDGATVSIDLSGGATDVDGDRLTYAATGLPPGLTLDPATGLASGRIDRSASQGGSGGVYAVTVTVTDGNGGSAARAFSWSVLNPPPVAQDDALTAHDGAAISGSVLADHGAGADADPDGDPITVSAVNGAAASVGQTVTGSQGGAFTISADGGYRFDPGADFRDIPAGGARDTTVTYAISDGQGGVSTATVTVTVLGSNHAPMADAIGDQIGADGQTVALNLGGFFTDLDRDALTFTATSLPPGLAIDRATGAITGQIASGASGATGAASYPATVTATDPSGAVAARSFTWRVTNPAPIAADDSATVAEDATATIDALSNDTDPDGDALTIVATGSSAPTAGHGVVTVANGQLVYTPNANFNGTDTIAYTIADGNGGFSSASVTVSVTPANDAPTADPLPEVGNRPGASVSYDVSGSFHDPDTDPLVAQSPSGDALAFAATGLPPGLSIDPATGVISGIAAAGLPVTTVYDVTVTATDRGGLSVSQGFHWTINNTAPIANPDTAGTTEDNAVTVAVTRNDVDPDGDAFALVDEPGAATAGHGSVTIDAASGALTYTPDANFNGVDTVSYTLRDANGAQATGTLTVTVSPVNDRPSAAAIADRSGADGQSASLALGAFFSDIDGDALTFLADGLPPGLTIDPATGVISGVIAADASGPAGATGYRVTVTARDRADPSDPQGLAVAKAFTWSITNPAPIAADDTATTLEDTPVDIDVVKAGSPPGSPGQDTDPDGDPLSVIPGSLLAANGTASLNPDGTVRYAPNPGFNGYDTLLYQISDGNGGVASASVTIRVDPVNDAPIASAIPATASSDGDTVDVDAGAFFSDPDATDRAPLSAPDRLTFSATGLPPGLAIDSATGRITGALPSDASTRVTGGAYVVTVTATDLSGATASSAFAWTVDDPSPIAVADSFGGPEDVAITGSVLANDSDPDGDALSVAIAPARGPAHGSVTLRADGSFTYAPDADFNGVDSFVYTLSDSDGRTTTATVTLTIAPVEDAPTANPDNATTPEDTPVTIDVLANDASRDGRPLTLVGATVDPALGSVAVNPDGTLTFAPAHDVNGPMEITYGLSDGQSAVSRGTLFVTITPVSDAPVVGADPVTTAEDTPVSGRIVATDADGDALSFTLVAPPSGGVVTIEPDGSYAYAPARDFNGQDSFVVEVSDGQGGVTRVTVPVTITPVNDAPVVSADPVTTAEDTPVAGQLVATDADGDALSFTLVAPPSGGVVTIEPDGSYAYAPNHDFNGRDSFTIEVSDGQGGVTHVTIPVTVTPVNDAPVASADPLKAVEDTPVAGQVVATDADGDALSFTLVTPPSGGVVTLRPDGSYTYAPARDFNGQDSFTIEVSDGQGGVARVTVPVTITPVNHAPVASAEPVTARAGAAALGRVSAVDSDGDTLDFRVTGGPANGTASVGSDGAYVYLSAPGFFGRDAFQVEVSDGHGGVTVVDVAVIVVANDPIEVRQPPLQPQLRPIVAPPAATIAAERVAIAPTTTTGYVLTAVEEIGRIESIARVVLAEGAVVRAVNGAADLHGGADLSGPRPVIEQVSDRIERVSIARLESNQAIDQPWFDARPYLGRSLELSLLGDEGGAATLRGVSMEAIRRSDSLVLNIVGLSPSTGSGIAEIRLRALDGGPAPAWLEQGGRAMFWGRPPAGAETIQIEVEFVLNDGEVVRRPVTIDVQSGEIRTLAKPRPATEAAPLFTRQLAAGAPASASDLALVERALERL